MSGEGEEAAVAGGEEVAGGNTFENQNTHKHTHKSLNQVQRSKERKRGGREAHWKKKRSSPEFARARRSCSSPASTVTVAEHRGREREREKRRRRRRRRGGREEEEKGEREENGEGERREIYIRPEGRDRKSVV